MTALIPERITALSELELVGSGTYYTLRPQKIAATDDNHASLVIMTLRN
jgi:hypothetical protein